MFVRFATTRYKGKIRRYAQIVESYRKPDGTPSHRVLLSLAGQSETTVNNVRLALKAGSLGRAVELAAETEELLQKVGVLANLTYLDLAVAYEQWHQLGLSSLLADLMPKTNALVPPQDVVCAMVMHRCIAPDSTAAAATWYPKTALPELQGIAPSRMNNSRFHRVLAALEPIEANLQQHLAQRLHLQQGAFAALFLDISDTWFEGRGPQMAYSAKTKEGMQRRKIGIMLLCDQRGYPVRWQSLPGNYYEATAMKSLVKEISTIHWAHKVPVVLDRMMGKASALTELSETGLHFLTALPACEFESWTVDVPWRPLADVSITGTRQALDEDLKRVRDAAMHTGMTKVTADRWVLDLGTVTRTDLGDSTAVESTGVVAEALRVALSMKADLEAQVVPSRKELAKQMGITRRCVSDYLKLTELTPTVKRRVLSGEAELLSLKKLRTVAGQPAQQQQAALDAVLKETRRKQKGRKPKVAGKRSGAQTKVGKSPATDGPGVTIRLVAAFHPHLFVEKRRIALETRRDLDAFIEDLNRRLRTPQSRRDEASIRGEVDRYLRKRNWVKLFEVNVDKDEAGAFQVKLVLDENAWQERRRYDGFALFAAHPDLLMSAADIVDLYFAKDVVEKDFRTIKSELELRPIRHRTDIKVRAHVTICMLALLVERALEQRIRQAELSMAASSLFDALEPVHLNRIQNGARISHTVTKCDPQVANLVTTLGLQHLVDDEQVLPRIHPRTNPSL